MRVVYPHKEAAMGSLGVIQLFGKVMLLAYAGIVLWSALETLVLRHP